MNLGFKQFFDSAKQEPTYFREKILAGAESIQGIISSQPFDPKIFVLKPKRHTIRLDPHNRWKPGRSIQMIYRGPKYSILDHFNKGIPELEKCVSVQKIEIRYKAVNGPKIYPLNPSIFIDGVQQLTLRIIELAVNDGFCDVEQFFKWFNKDFTGVLIHWTDLKY